jgi:hypothetical protein
MVSGRADQLRQPRPVSPSGPHWSFGGDTFTDTDTADQLRLSAITGEQYVRSFEVTRPSAIDSERRPPQLVVRTTLSGLAK